MRATNRTAAVELAALLDRAANLELDDPAWETLSADARRVTSRLAAAGDLASSLVAARTDPPVVVARLLATAWLRLPSDPDGRQPWDLGYTAVG